MAYQMLIVDDSASIVQGIADIVQNHFPGVFALHRAENGVAALRMLQLHPIAVVITDIKMPLMDGVQLLRAIRLHCLACEVVALSGYDDYGLVRDMLRYGAYDYLLKPVNINAFVQIINDLLSVIDGRVFTVAEIADLSSSGQENIDNHDFFDLPVNRPLSRNALQAELQRAIPAVLNGEPEQAAARLEAFFDGASPATLDEDELRGLLIRFIYSLMERNPAFIKIISSYKLTDFDIMSFVKNLPTLSQLKKRFCATLDRYVRDYRRIGGGYQFIIKKARAYIEENFADNISLSEVADYIHLNPNYFSAIFKAETGTTFRDYLRGVRIEKSKTMIASGQMKLNEIAQMVGYQDASHFNRAFKEVTGMPPSMYRRQVYDDEI